MAKGEGERPYAGIGLYFHCHVSHTAMITLARIIFIEYSRASYFELKRQANLKTKPHGGLTTTIIRRECCSTL